MSRKSLKPRHVDSEEPGQDSANPGESPVKRAAMTKADAIRAALRAGVESPTAASNYIRERFGIDVSRTHFSAFKSLAKRAENVDADDAVAGGLTPARLEAISDGDLIAALEVMKPLVASLGADKVKRIVDLLG